MIQFKRPKKNIPFSGIDIDGEPIKAKFGPERMSMMNQCRAVLLRKGIMQDKDDGLVYIVDDEGTVKLDEETLGVQIRFEKKWKLNPRDTYFIRLEYREEEKQDGVLHKASLYEMGLTPKGKWKSLF